jgi:hypothetical protein
MVTGISFPGPDVKVTLQLAVDGPVPVRLQLGVIVSALLVQETVPLGVTGLGGDVSVTTVVHVVDLWSTTLLDAHVTLVEVFRAMTFKDVDP